MKSVRIASVFGLLIISACNSQDGVAPAQPAVTPTQPVQTAQEPISSAQVPFNPNACSEVLPPIIGKAGNVTPGLWANVLWGRIPEVQKLLSSGSSAKEMDQRGCSLLNPAMGYRSNDEDGSFYPESFGSLEMAELLLKSGLDVESSCPIRDYAPPLLVTFDMGAEGGASLSQFSQLLLKHGANPNRGDLNQRTPLMAASARMDRHGSSLIEVLLKAGACSQSRDLAGSTALHYVATADDPLYPGSIDSWERIELLVKAGTPINAQDEDGDTALILSVKWGSQPTAACKKLLALGADPSIQNKEGKAAQDYPNWAQCKN